MPRLTAPRSLLLLLVMAVLAVEGLLAFARGGGGEPEGEPFSRIGSAAPSLDSGYQDWPLCSMENRIVSQPRSIRALLWSPAAVVGPTGPGSRVPCGAAVSTGSWSARDRDAERALPATLLSAAAEGLSLQGLNPLSREPCLLHPVRHL